MKRYLLPIAILSLLFSGCAREEQGFKVEGEPYFNIVVRDPSDKTGVPIAELDEMSAQYTLNLGSDAWSSAKDTKNHVSAAPRFHVNSNMRWKIVSATGEDEPWIIPFPSSGEKEGLFFFKTTRHIDPDNAREALFNIMVDKGNGFEPLEGILAVNQQTSAHFLEMNAAMFNVESPGKTIRLYVTANVDWTYTLTPSETYATPDTSWIKDKSAHVPSKQVDTLVFTLAQNGPGIRGADLAIEYSIDGTAHKDVVPITQYPATEADIEGFPVKWAVRIAENTYSSTWPAAGTIPPVSGAGLITWHNESGLAADKNGKVSLDIKDNSPWATGVWPGDYLELAAYSPVSAGTIVRVAFTTRVSGSGQKYWRLEYRDGEEWKIAGKSFTDESVPGPDGNPVVYTHAMESGGETNIRVEALVTYASVTDQVEFRFICAANYMADDTTPKNPTGASWRLSVDEASAEDPGQPLIDVVAPGAEVITKANLEVLPQYLVFEGSGSALRRFTVSCDQVFSLIPSHPWIHVSDTASVAGNDLQFTVYCDDNNLAGTREGSVAIKAGITRGSIAIIQGSAAGGSPGEGLEPFISVVSGSRVSVPGIGGSAALRVLSNFEPVASVSADWLTVTKAPGSKAAAEVTEYTVTAAANNSETDSRTGVVFFRNPAGTLESAVTVTQAPNEELVPAVFPIVWSMPAANNKSGVDYSLNNASGSWVYSDTHEGKLTVIRTSTQEANSNATTYQARSMDKEPRWNGKHCLLHYGMNKGDYWLFEAYNVKNLAGTYEIEYCMESSGSGPKYFLLEYSLDGNSWTAIDPVSGSYGDEAPFSYTYAIDKASTVFTITKSVHLGAISSFSTLSFRARIMSRSRVSGSEMPINHGATNRVGDHITISFTADKS